jgi:hypothetical protein
VKVILQSVVLILLVLSVALAQHPIPTFYSLNVPFHSFLYAFVYLLDILVVVVVVLVVVVLVVVVVVLVVVVLVVVVLIVVVLVAVLVLL